MAQTTKERLKELLLLAFVAGCVLLVGLVWLDGLGADAEALPGYYRGAPETGESVSPAGDRPAPEPGPGAATPTRRHGGRQSEPHQEATGEPAVLPSLDGDDV